MQIILTPEIEKALLVQARQRGTTPEQLALQSLRELFVHPAQHADQDAAEGTLADLLADSIGVLHSGEHVSGGAQMSADPGAAFAEALLERRRQGRLYQPEGGRTDAHP